MEAVGCVGVDKNASKQASRHASGRIGAGMLWTAKGGRGGVVCGRQILVVMVHAHHPDPHTQKLNTPLYLTVLRKGNTFFFFF